MEQYAQREKLMDFLGGHIQTFIKAKDSYKNYKHGFEYKIKKFLSFILFWTGKRFGNYLIILYIFVKLLYLINVVGQLFLMTRLLGISNYYLLGFEILNRMASGLDMIKNHYFPKVTHCDFKIRELGNDHLYTVQCVLSINIFTEKIYIILWFWFVVLSAFTFIDLCMFVFRNCLPSQRYFYVKKHVFIFSNLKKTNQMKVLNEFSNKFLKPDVILVLKIIATNVNDLVVSELVKHLWDSFVRQRPSLAADKDDDPNFIQDYDYGEPSDDDEAVNNGEKTPAFPLENKANSRRSVDEEKSSPDSKSANNPQGIKSILRSLKRPSTNDDQNDVTVIKKNDTNGGAAGGSGGPISMV